MVDGYASVTWFTQFFGVLCDCVCFYGRVKVVRHGVRFVECQASVAWFVGQYHPAASSTGLALNT